MVSRAVVMMSSWSPLIRTDDDVEVDNDIGDDNLDTEHDDAETDDDINDNNLDSLHDDDMPLRFCSIDIILRMSEFASRALVVEELHVVSSDEPTSFDEAEGSPSWMKVMMEEMMPIDKNDTWSLVNLPPGRQLIRVKWVFKVKQNEHGAVSKHKPHLVVKGYA
jgi:hypothetical protein